MRPALLALAGSLLVSATNAAVVAPHYPSDVDSFITRVSECNSLSSKDTKLLSENRCSEIASDRTALTVKYRRNAELVSAINGRWIKIVQRVNPPVDIAPSIRLDLKGGSYLLLSDGKVWSDGKAISCAELKKIAPYLFHGRGMPTLTGTCKSSE